MMTLNITIWHFCYTKLYSRSFKFKTRKKQKVLETV